MSEESHLHQNQNQQLAVWLGDEPDPEIEPDQALTALDSLVGAGPPEAALAAMREALDTWWAEQHTVIYYASIEAPIGRVYAAASEQGVVSVDFGLRGDTEYLRHLREAHLAGTKVVVRHEPARLEEVTRQLKEYFRGERDTFDFPVDLSHLTSFQRQVLDATRNVPPGRVVSYKEIAQRIGNPRASRAVGNALGCNPVPIVIPCHRVLPQDGSLGGYSGGGGSKTKARLLEIEGVLPGKGGLYAFT